MEEKRDYKRNPPRIFIAVGHGGSDPGAVNQKLKLRESDCNMAVAVLLQSELERHGIRVGMSRTGDEEDRLKDEIAECNAYAPDFALAIHTNASANGSGSGFEVYYQLQPWVNSQLSLRMANLLNRNVANQLGVKTRGVKTRNDLGWLKQVQAPCVLVENFFIDGPLVEWYRDPAQLARLCRAYVLAILEFYGITYRPNQLFQVKLHKILDDLTTAKVYSCSAMLVDGSYYVNLRQFARLAGLEVYFDAERGNILLYPPEYYAESDFQSGLLKLSDFSSRTEQILAGISVEEGRQYRFDEYDYDEESGKLEQALCL